MYSIQIVEWIDRSYPEVIVCVKSDNVELLAYSAPYMHEPGSKYVHLCTLYAENVLREKTYQPPRKTDVSQLSYQITARVIDRRESLVKLNDILITLDCGIPRDIENGDLISFDIHRLEL